MYTFEINSKVINRSSHRRYWIFTALSLLIPITYAADGDLGMADSVQTVGGLLKVAESNDIGEAVFLNNKEIPSLDNTKVSLDYKMSIAGNDVIVVHTSAFAASNCFDAYSFLTITPQGRATVAKESADACDAKIESTANSIKITSIEHDGRRTKTTITTYTKDGVVQSR
jgi:hypothetical protein